MFGGRDRLRRARTLARLTVRAFALAVLTIGGAVGGTLGAEPAKPEYLPYTAFTSDDSAGHIALKQAYNDAVLRYNQALYDYHVTLERHDQLVEIHNGSSDPVERQRAREQATPLRARLTVLRREVISRAGAVDLAVSRAAGGGVTINR